MDPAFSLADELAELGHSTSGLSEDELQFHPHSSLGDEFGSAGLGSLDAELEGMHLQHQSHLGNDLASELGGGVGVGGGWAEELDPEYGAAGAEGSLADELNGGAMSRGESTSTYASEMYDSRASSPAPGSRQAGVSRNSEFLTSGPSRRTPSTSSDATATISLLAASQTSEIAESLKATQEFLHQLSSLSSSSTNTTTTTTATKLSMFDSGDGEDTARLESAAAGYLKLVSECTVEREAQLRELRELDRRFARALAEDSTSAFGMSSSSSWSSDLASFSTIASSSTLTDVEEEQDSLASPPASPLDRNARRRRSTASHSSDATITDLPTLSSSLTPFIDTTLFAPFYTSTSTLVTSLTSLHEHTQITKSSTADAARKLKSLKTLIHQWKSEQESVELSETWIRSNPKQDGKRTEGSSRRWVEGEVEWCQNRIDQAEARARELLTPVSIAS